MSMRRRIEIASATIYCKKHPYFLLPLFLLSKRISRLRQYHNSVFSLELNFLVPKIEPWKQESVVLLFAFECNKIVQQWNADVFHALYSRRLEEMKPDALNLDCNRRDECSNTSARNALSVQFSLFDRTIPLGSIDWNQMDLFGITNTVIQFQSFSFND